MWNFQNKINFQNKNPWTNRITEEDFDSFPGTIVTLSITKFGRGAGKTCRKDAFFENDSFGPFDSFMFLHSKIRIWTQKPS